MKVGICFGFYLGITARSLLEQETLYSCLAQIQASGCQKALKLRLPPAKPLAVDADTALWRESTIPWWECPEAHNAELPNPSSILLLWGQLEYSLWAQGAMMLCRSVTWVRHLVCWLEQEVQLRRALSNQSIEYLQGQRHNSLDNHSAVRAASWTVYLHLNTPGPWHQTGQSISTLTCSSPWNVWQGT